MSDRRLTLIMELEDLSNELDRASADLRTAAQTLRSLREIEYHKAKIQQLKDRVRSDS